MALGCCTMLGLGLASFPCLARSHPRIVGTAANRMAEEVLGTLVLTPLGRAAPPLPWAVILIEDRHLNAYSNGPGWVTVTSGMARMLGNDRGAWAVVLGHEVGHFVINERFSGLLPGFQKELERAYFQARAPSGGGKGAAPAALLLVPMGGGPSHRRRLREREYEADRVGLLLMAQAGYHPDFMIAFERRIRAQLGDRPGPELLSSHPRWTEREASTTAAHEVARQIFESRWPDPAHSPGGPPPPLGTIGTVAARTDAAGGLVLQVLVTVRNTATMPVRVEVIFLDEQKRVQTSVPEYRSPDGSLVLNAIVPTLSGASQVRLSLPSAALPTKPRGLKAVVFLLAADQVLDVYFEPVEPTVTGP